MRELSNDFVRDRQPTDAGVEDADRRGIRHHHCERRADGRAATAARHGAPSRAGHVPQVRGDERIGAGEEMIRDEERDPILDVRCSRRGRTASLKRGACDDFALAQCHPSLDVRDDDASRSPMRRASCTSAAGFANHREADRLDEHERAAALFRPSTVCE